MRLFIAEKPSQAAEIAKNLPGPLKRNEGFIETKGGVVTWLFGHILRQAEPEEYDEKYKTWRLNDLPIIPQEWKLVVSSSAAKQFRVVKRLLSEASEVVHAGDPDREGQLLVDELLEYLKNKKRVLRLLLNALDERTVKKALQTLKDNKDFFPLKESALARARADWLIGMNLSRAYTLAAQKAGHKGVFPIGRVKTPTLALVVSREREIASFRPVNYFSIVAEFAHQNGKFKARWKPATTQRGLDTEGRLVDAEEAKSVHLKLQQGGPGKVLTLETKEIIEHPRLPFSLSALQILANRKYGLDPQAVLDTAQALYEKKLTSYPRSDCDYLPESQHKEAEEILVNLKEIDHHDLSTWVLKANPAIQSKCWNDEKVSAHHAIIPTIVKCDYEKLTDQEKKIYFLIAQVFICQFYPPHTYLQTKVSVDYAQEKFLASGKTIKEAGWRKVYGMEEEEDGKGEGDEETQVLPAMGKGDPLVFCSSEALKKATKPPPRFTTGTLLKAMKEVHRYVHDQSLKSHLKDVSGIGTEATRATIIKELLARKFLKEEKKFLKPTNEAYVLIDALPAELTYPDTTAIWETKFDAMIKGQGSFERFMVEQAQFVTSLCAKAQGLEVQRAKSEPQVPQKDAPKGTSQAIPCPTCKTGILRLKTGTKGKFWGCSRYPECKATFNDKNGKPTLK